jgi:anti-anti-sigma factor
MRDTIASLDLEAGGDVLVATVEGEIDSSNAAELRLALSERLPSAASALVLDLSKVTYLDSAGVHLIFELGRRLAARRQAIRLVIGPRSPIRRVLEMCAVEAVAPIDLDREASLGAVAAAGISARD